MFLHTFFVVLIASSQLFSVKNSIQLAEHFEPVENGAIVAPDIASNEVPKEEPSLGAKTLKAGCKIAKIPATILRKILKYTLIATKKATIFALRKTGMYFLRKIIRQAIAGIPMTLACFGGKYLYKKHIKKLFFRSRSV